MVTSISINDEATSGYLGNQLFKFSALLGYSKKYNEEVVLPDWDVAKYLKHPPKISENIIVENEYTEPFFHYQEIPHKNNLNINGYFQSYKYFENVDVKKSLEPTDDLKEKILNTKNKKLDQTYEEIFAYNSVVAIHVRLGDYIAFQSHFTNLSQIDYYKKAIENFNGVEKFLVFSNDIPKAKEMFVGDRFLFSESEQEKQQGNKSAIFDLYLMSMCNHFIIANSTFSYWGAFLGNNPKKRVISPGGKSYKWFGPLNSHLDTKDLLPESWIKL